MAEDKPYNPFDPEQHKDLWDTFFFQRAPGMWYRPDQISFDRATDTIMSAPYASGGHFDPRPDIPVEDQRGLSPAELDLQAQFQKSRGLGPWEKPAFGLDPEAPATPMAKALGVDDIKSAANEIALRQAGETLSMHKPDIKVEAPRRIKKKEVK
jgi:hypothetical protein